MSLIENIVNLDKKFSWSFFGLFIGLIGIIISIYFSAFYKKNNEITFDILANTPIISISENIPPIRLFYKNEDITKSKKRIFLLTIKVINSGEIDILTSQYDENELLGFRITNGTFAENPQIIDSSSKYLNENVKIKLSDKSVAKFSKIIFESKEYFIVKSLILVDDGINPQIVPTGKIAGIKEKETKVIKSYDQTKDEPLWSMITSGSLLIHFIRFFYYILVIFISAIFVSILVVLIFFTTDAISKSNRKKKIKKFKSKIDFEEAEKFELIFKFYLENDEDEMLKMLNLIKNKESLKSAVEKNKSKPSSELHEFSVMQPEKFNSMYTSENTIIDYFLKYKLIKIFNINKIHVEKDFISGLEKFVKFINYN
jgi:hypothetical protein